MTVLEPTSRDVEYRYTLTRTVGDDPRQLCWVMLNPSTADESTDDPTIRRVIRFTRDNGYGRLIVVNLFAARTTRPRHLLEMSDPVGPNNFDIIREAIQSSDDVVFAWGAWWAANCRDTSRRFLWPPPVTFLARNAGRTALCLGKTRAGDPRHPLYVAASQPLVAFQ